MQALEWGFQKGFVDSVVTIACGAEHTPWQIGGTVTLSCHSPNALAVSEAQRQAIYADPLWNGGDYDTNHPPAAGLGVARQIAMISYRSHKAYGNKFGRKKISTGQFEVEGYLHHQGQKFVDRYDAMSYVTVTKMMDTHDVGRGERLLLSV